MSHQCNHGSCNTSQGGLAHHKSCGCSCHDCQCCSNQGHEEEEGCPLLHLANEAWMEVLKEKIKERIRATDKKIDEIATIVAETNRDLWHQKMAKDNLKEAYEERLHKLFSQK